MTRRRTSRSMRANMLLLANPESHLPKLRHYMHEALERLDARLLHLHHEVVEGASHHDIVDAAMSLDRDLGRLNAIRDILYNDGEELEMRILINETVPEYGTKLRSLLNRVFPGPR